MNGLALFAGICGLELGIKQVLGEQYRTVCYVEKDPYAAAVIASRIRSGDLDNAPIWDDICTFDGKSLRGLVDLISGGFPCQDLSIAGKQRGITGERSKLWKEFARLIREIRPSFQTLYQYLMETP